MAVDEMVGVRITVDLVREVGDADGVERAQQKTLMAI